MKHMYHTWKWCATYISLKRYYRIILFQHFDFEDIKQSKKAWGSQASRFLRYAHPMRRAGERHDM
jgi:hypothetical protein